MMWMCVGRVVESGQEMEMVVGEEGDGDVSMCHRVACIT